MINKLVIKNYAIINNLEVDFSKGLTTITGETGAGKSIILGALNLLLGDRFDSVNFKDKLNKSIVEGTFDVSNLNINFFFLDHDIDYDPILIIRREFTFEGKSRAFINDTPVKIDLLKKIGVYLIDIHSQHENLLINNDVFQINLIDKFSENKFPDFSPTLFSFKKLLKEFNVLALNIESKKREFLNTNLDVDYQRKLILEVEGLNLKIGEKGNLEFEYKRMKNTHLIKQNLTEILLLFENVDSSIMTHLNAVISKLSDISDYDMQITALLDRLKENAVDFNDIIMDFHTINHDLNLDSNKLQFIEDRINSINVLENKLGVSNVQEILTIIDNIKDELISLDAIESEIKQLEKDKKMIQNQLFDIADSLTLFRKQSAFDLIELLKNDLFNLGIEDANIDFSFIKTKELLHNGTDKVNLLFSANKGYDLKPLSSVASGGEISRLMLCVKKNLFQLSSFSTIIFDEIDSGVSGEIGRKMGRILKKISFKGQVVCITHLPQIASLGDYHYKVLKNSDNNVISTTIEALSFNERIDELARMLSGDKVHKEAIANAKKMMDI